jgi:hypothetical protein
MSYNGRGRAGNLLVVCTQQVDDDRRRICCPCVPIYDERPCCFALITICNSGYLQMHLLQGAA